MRRAVTAEATEQSRGPGTNTLLAIGSILLTALVVTAVILLPPYPPVQDFIEWTYQADIMTDPGFGTAPPGVRLAEHPVPNSLFQLVLAALALAMPAPIAGKVFLLGYVAVSVALAWALSRRYHPEAWGAVTSILLITFLFNTPFWNGYGNYQTGLLLFAAWFLLPAERRTAPPLILVFAVVFFFTHAMIFAAFAVIVGLQALTERRVVSTALAFLPSLALAAWYVLRNDPPAEEDVPGQVEQLNHLVYKAYTLAKIGPYHNFVFDVGGDAALRPAMFWSGTAINLLYAAGLVAALAWGLWTAMRQKALPLVPAAAAAVLGVLFLVLPSRIQTVLVNPGERLMYPALLLLLLFLPLPRPLIRALGASVIVLLLSLSTLAFGEHPWGASVSPAGPQHMDPERLLFWHRPTAFVCKWQEMQRRRAEHDVARVPITFRTSLLVGEGGDECDPDWRIRPRESGRGR